MMKRPIVPTPAAAASPPVVPVVHQVEDDYFCDYVHDITGSHTSLALLLGSINYASGQGVPTVERVVRLSTDGATYLYALLGQRLQELAAHKAEQQRQLEVIQKQGEAETQQPQQPAPQA